MATDLLPFESLQRVPFGSALRSHFLFSKGYRNLNHGSYGTYPDAILTLRQHCQQLNEENPDLYFRKTFPQLLQHSRAELASFLGVPVQTVVLVSNATTGTNTVLRNLKYAKDEVIVYFSIAYGALEKTILYIKEALDVEVRRIGIELPLEDADIIAKFNECVDGVRAQGKRVKIAAFDTIVSQPGVRLPFEALVKACKDMGILSCVDAAHGVGHISLSLSTLDPDFLTSNCHKWLFTPRGCAFLYVPVRNQHLIRSTIPTSWGFEPLSDEDVTPSPLPDADPTSTKFEQMFEGVGTADNSAYALIPHAVKWREQVCGGEEAIYEYCHEQVQKAGRMMAESWGTSILDNKTHTLTKCVFANVELPLSKLEGSKYYIDGIHDGEEGAVSVAIGLMLLQDFDCFIATCWHAGKWWARLSGMVYLDDEDWAYAKSALDKVCGRIREGAWRT